MVMATNYFTDSSSFFFAKVYKASSPSDCRKKNKSAVNGGLGDTYMATNEPANSIGIITLRVNSSHWIYLRNIHLSTTNIILEHFMEIKNTCIAPKSFAASRRFVHEL